MRSLLFTILVFAALGCPNPAADQPKAEVKPPEPTPEKGVDRTAEGEVVFEIESSQSKVEFVGSKVTGSHAGYFQRVSGAVYVLEGSAEKSRVHVEIDTGSVVVPDSAKLTEHLKSPDFFDVQKFPKADFDSIAVKPVGVEGATHTITGNFELHGVTKSITVPATIGATPEKITVKSEFSINRQDFGVKYPGMPDDLIKDDVLIKLDIVALARPSE